MQKFQNSKYKVPDLQRRCIRCGSIDVSLSYDGGKTFKCVNCNNEWSNPNYVEPGGGLGNGSCPKCGGPANANRNGLQCSWCLYTWSLNKNTFQFSSMKRGTLLTPSSIYWNQKPMEFQSMRNNQPQEITANQNFQEKNHFNQRNSLNQRARCKHCSSLQTQWNEDNGHTYRCNDCGGQSHTGKFSKECSECAFSATQDHEYPFM